MWSVPWSGGMRVEALREALAYCLDLASFLSFFFSLALLSPYFWFLFLAICASLVELVSPVVWVCVCMSHMYLLWIYL